ncbi:MAG: helix-turn-helix domain-containing protein [Deltaproteobacteria bacterium]|nr:helix-turn-helix domain-containing protein [Deltaproteobacteria bacterium]
MTEQSKYLPRPPKKSRRPAVKAEAIPSVVPTERPGPEGGKRAENRRTKANLLASAALRLMLERGIEAVTIDDIVVQAGVAKGSFYRYFDDKEALVRGILAPLEEPLHEAFTRCRRALADADRGPSLVAPYASFAAEIAHTIFELESVTRLYLQERRGANAGARRPIARLARFIDDSAETLAAFANARGLTRPGDSQVSAAVVVGAAEHLAYRALLGETQLRSPAVAVELIAIILDGVRLSE